MRSPWSRTNATGSTPPISRWPVSRHHPTSRRSSASRTCSSVSTNVPTWGCSATVRPSPAAIASIASTLAARLRQPSSSSSVGCVQPSSSTIDSTNIRAPAAASSVDASRASRAASPSERWWSTSGTNAPTSCRSWRPSVSRNAPGSVGKNPGGPSSVPRSPTEAISDRTRSGSGITPQPGTSHAPHEIGAPARRSLTAALLAIGASLQRPKKKGPGDVAGPSSSTATRSARFTSSPTCRACRRHRHRHPSRGPRRRSPRW